MTPPTVLTVAGSDSGGGAGIQADLKAFAATGVHGACSITSVTSQNTEGVERVDGLGADAVTAQVDAVFDDLDVRAVKTGMLHTPDVVEAVAQALDGREVPVVVDPVMVATSGDALAEGRLEEALAALADVTTLVTPNVSELEMLTERTVETLEDARAAAEAMREAGWANVLAKGGHLDTATAVDLLVREDGDERTLEHPRLDGPFHGAGCTYSSLIAGLLARGYPLDAAVGEARARMQRALQRAYEPGSGPAVLDALETHTPSPRPGAALGEAAWTIAARLPETLVPEVGINLAQAPEEADTVEDALGLSRRITRGADGTTPPGPVVEGASAHVARVVLAAQRVRPEIRAAMNLARPPALLEAAEAADLETASFDRTREPEEVDSTMTWGTTRALKRNPQARLVLDEGAQGKEPMARLIAESPGQLRDTALELFEALER